MISRDQFDYYMQGAPEPLPNQMRGPDGSPLDPRIIEFTVQMQRLQEQKRRQQQPELQWGQTRTRPTRGGYYSMSGKERNAMRAQQARAKAMMNTQYGPLQTTPLQATPLQAAPLGGTTMADLNADWNPYTSGPTFYYADDGTQFDNPSALNMYNRGRLGMNRFMGGSRGGGGVSRGTDGGMGGLAQSYADAYNGARSANEGRYNEILGGFDELMGGGKKQAKRSGNSAPTARIRSKFQSYQDSGSPLGYFEWLRLMRGGERRALETGGQFGSMNATGLYPRMWGMGEFLGSPSQAGNRAAEAQRPVPAPPQYPTYTPPARTNQNY